MRYLTVVTIFLCITSNIFSQKLYKQAEKKFEAKEYYAAIDLYKSSYSDCSKELRPEVIWKIAECYRLVGDTAQARQMYIKAVRAQCTQTDQAKAYLADAKLLAANMYVPPPAKLEVTPDPLATIDTNRVIILKKINLSLHIYLRLDSISPGEIKELGTLLLPCVNNFKKYLQDLSKYKYQCVPVINEKGERLIFVNALCRSDKDWKKGLIEGDDGGNCYFHFYLNLSKKTCLNFQTNGVG